MSETVTYTYQVPVAGAALIVMTGASEWPMYIPCDLENPHYQAFLAWIAAGNPAPEGWTGPTNSSTT